MQTSHILMLAPFWQVSCQVVTRAVIIPDPGRPLGGKQAILKGDWKAVRLMVKDDPQSVLMESARVPSKKFNFGMKTYSGE